MTKINHEAVFAQTFRRFQSNFVAPAHAGVFSLTAMLANLQSQDQRRQEQTPTEVIATLNQVADSLADMTSVDAGTPSKDVLALLGGVVALCADVLTAHSYAGFEEKGERP